MIYDQIDFGKIFDLVLISIILIAIPGPSIMYIIGQAISAGKSKATWSVIGNAIGMFIVSVVLAIGLGPVLLQSDFFLKAIKITGSIILILIGVKYLTPEAIKDKRDNRYSVVSNPFLGGLIVGITNPKSIIMFGTIVPSYLPDGDADITLMLLIYGLIPITLGLAIDYAWLITSHTLSVKLISNTKKMRLINIAGGFLIIGMAISLALNTIMG